jgi:ribonuclease R
MADDYYRFVERAHILRGENTGKEYRLGDKVAVQVVKVDMERRQVDLGLVEILEAVRASERNRGPRRSSAEPRRLRPADAAPGRGWSQAQAKKNKPKKSGARKQRPGRHERAARKGK